MVGTFGIQHQTVSTFTRKLNRAVGCKNKDFALLSTVACFKCRTTCNPSQTLESSNKFAVRHMKVNNIRVR